MSLEKPPVEPASYDRFTLLRSRLQDLFLTLSDAWFNPYPPVLQLGGFRGNEKLREPAMEWLESDKEVILRFYLPGIQPEHITVEVLGNVVSIYGEDETAMVVTTRSSDVLYRETMPGHFQRIVPLPFHVDSDQAKATIDDNGIVEVILPKPEAASKTRKPIPINPYFHF